MTLNIDRWFPAVSLDWREVCLSRRILLRASLGLSLAGLLAACSVGGDDDDDDDSDEPVAASTKAATESEADSTERASTTGESTTRTIEHALGSSEVPASPQRIIALDPYVTLPTAVAVDAPVIGCCQLPYGDPFPVFIDLDKVAGIEDVGWLPELDLEKMVMLEPDLIVGQRSFVEEIYDRASTIAPTVAIETDTDDGEHRRNWQDVVRDVAEALGAEDVVEGLLDDYAARVADLQAQLGDGLDTTDVSLTNFRSMDDIRIYTVDSCAGQTLAEVGFSRPDGQGPVPGKINIGLSIEQLKKIDADVLFYFAGSAATNPEDASKQSEEIISNPLWDQLEAVQNDKAYQVDQRWWFSCGSIQAANKILDDLFTIFNAD